MFSTSFVAAKSLVINERLVELNQNVFDKINQLICDVSRFCCCSVRIVVVYTIECS